MPVHFVDHNVDAKKRTGIVMVQRGTNGRAVLDSARKMVHDICSRCLEGAFVSGKTSATSENVRNFALDCTQ